MALTLFPQVGLQFQSGIINTNFLFLNSEDFIPITAYNIKLSNLILSEYQLTDLKLNILCDLNDIIITQYNDLNNLIISTQELKDLYAIDDTEDISTILSKLTNWNINQLNSIILLDINKLDND